MNRPTTVADLAGWLEAFAPSRLAESWDNVGLLLGDPAAEVGRAMTCLTVTPATAAEAIAAGAGAIVSHHPILFRPVQALRPDRVDLAATYHLARAGVAVLSPHTAFDNTRGGINDGLAERLGLVDVRSLRPARGAATVKVVAFAPEGEVDAILRAGFAAGAGRIGAYAECSYRSTGIGTFFGLDGSTPAVGRAGRREEVAEARVELPCPADRAAAVVAAIRSAHSYEEPAIEVYPLDAGPGRAGDPGAGRVGDLPRSTTLAGLAAEVARMLEAPATQFAGDPGRPVGRVAICCGAGEDFLGDARTAGADVLLTGEARFHRAMEAEATGIGLIVAGHHATERPGVEDLARRLAAAFPALDVWASRAERDPLRAVGPPGSK